jgi:phage baseplate assembly protein gpV
MLLTLGGLIVVAALAVFIPQLITPGGHPAHPKAAGSSAPAARVGSSPLSAIASGVPVRSPRSATSSGSAAASSSFGYPDATNSGIPADRKLLTVPGQVSKGRGWYYDPRGWVEVNGNGAVLQGLSIPYNVDVTGSNVTIKDDQINVTGDSFGVSLRHTHNVTIENTNIFGGSGSNRLMVGIKDIYGDCSNTRVLDDNIWYTATGIQIFSGLIQGNYIHDMRFINGDHVNGITSNGGTTPLTIEHNTVLVNNSQTDAIGLFEDFGVEANVLITNNLVGGGGYAIYGGQNSGGPATHNIRITNNRFSRTYYPQSGYFGPATAFNLSGSGNEWSGNTWLGSSQEISAPSD